MKVGHQKFQVFPFANVIANKLFIDIKTYSAKVVGFFLILGRAMIST